MSCAVTPPASIESTLSWFGPATTLTAFDDHGDWKGDITAFLAIAPEFLSGFKVTMHMMGLPLIDLQGDRADVETYAIAWHQRPGSRDGSLKDDVWGVRYLDRFERRGGEWRIANRTMVRDWRRVDDASAKTPGATAG